MSRQNPNIEDPTTGGEPNPDVEPQPVPPDQGPEPPIEEPPDQPGLPDDQPDPTPIGDPPPNEPTRLV